MRKQYHKPVLFAERFTLVEHIADCAPGSSQYGTVSGMGDIQNCVFTTTLGSTYFIIDTACSGADMQVDSLDGIEIVSECYNGPSGTMTIGFTS